jgi:hypothetical protein
MAYETGGRPLELQRRIAGGSSRNRTRLPSGCAEEGVAKRGGLSLYVGGTLTPLRRRIAVAPTAAARQKLARRN